MPLPYVRFPRLPLGRFLEIRADLWISSVITNPYLSAVATQRYRSLPLTLSGVRRYVHNPTFVSQIGDLRTSFPCRQKLYPHFTLWLGYARDGSHRIPQMDYFHNFFAIVHVALPVNSS